MKAMFICIWYDGDAMQATLVDTGEGPFGKRPEDIGLPDDAQINAFVRVPDDTEPGEVTVNLDDIVLVVDY